MTPPTSRTQLEEAIWSAMDLSVHKLRVAIQQHPVVSTRDSNRLENNFKSDVAARVLAAVDAHVKRVLGEDEAYDHSSPFTNQKDRWNEKIAPRRLLRVEQRLRAGLEETRD